MYDEMLKTPLQVFTNCCSLPSAHISHNCVNGIKPGGGDEKYQIHVIIVQRIMDIQINAIAFTPRLQTTYA